eukprot:5447886-Alexandrium_andersonii.AAC.1
MSWMWTTPANTAPNSGKSCRMKGGESLRAGTPLGLRRVPPARSSGGPNTAASLRTAAGSPDSQ